MSNSKDSENFSKNPSKPNKSRQHIIKKIKALQEIILQAYLDGDFFGEEANKAIYQLKTLEYNLQEKLYNQKELDNQIKIFENEQKN